MLHGNLGYDFRLSRTCQELGQSGLSIRASGHFVRGLIIWDGCLSGDLLPRELNIAL